MDFEHSKNCTGNDLRYIDCLLIHTRSASGSISSGGGVEYHNVGLTLPSSTSPAMKASLLINRV